MHRARTSRSAARSLPLLAAAIGAVGALGLQPFGVWPATPIALALAFWQLACAPSPRRGALAGLGFGAGWFAVALHWIVAPFLVTPEIHAWMAPFALILMALGGGIFWAIPTYAAHRLLRGPKQRAAGIALGLLLAEWLRGWIFTGFPWAQPGQVWIGTPVAQLAAWSSQLGLTALTFLIAVLPVLLWRPRGPAARRAAPGLAAAAVLLALAWTAGLARLALPDPAVPGPVLRLVQPDAAQALKWDPVWADEFWRRLLAQSGGPTDAGRLPDAVIWPETAVPFLLNDADAVLPVISAAADNRPVILGIQRAEGPRWFNSLVEITPQATVGAIYDKVHLVPFGEYIPFGDALARIGIGAFAAQNGMGYTKGAGMRAISVPGLPPFQPLICYEAIFPQHLRGVDADWILQITNDAWFGKFSGPFQHLAQARLRAIETGRPVLRAANTGVSAVIDARGRVTAQLGLGRVGRIDAALPGRLPSTPWLVWGNGPLLGLMLLAALLLGLWDRPRRVIDAPALRL